MVLMAVEGRASGECFLAVRIGAFVRPLAGVSPSVASQGAAVAKRLVSSQLLWTQRGPAPVVLTLAQISQWCGFSPVCTRWCTVRADRWMNCFPQLGHSQA